jgi:hypothetical protein
MTTAEDLLVEYRHAVNLGLGEDLSKSPFDMDERRGAIAHAFNMARQEMSQEPNADHAMRLAQALDKITAYAEQHGVTGFNGYAPISDVIHAAFEGRDPDRAVAGYPITQNGASITFSQLCDQAGVTLPQARDFTTAVAQPLELLQYKDGATLEVDQRLMQALNERNKPKFAEL